MQQEMPEIFHFSGSATRMLPHFMLCLQVPAQTSMTGTTLLWMNTSLQCKAHHTGASPWRTCIIVSRPASERDDRLQTVSYGLIAGISPWNSVQICLQLRLLCSCSRYYFRKLCTVLLLTRSNSVLPGLAKAGEGVF